MPRTRGTRFSLFAVAWLSAFSAAEPRAQTTPPSACAAPEYRQFDFWIGEWDVKAPDGSPAGRSSITRELDGCVIHEHYLSAGAGGTYEGQSLNLYEAQTRTWRQSWVDNGGQRLALLQGTFKDGRMVLEGEATSRQGHHKTRMMFSVLDGGLVRQHVEFLFDGMTEWKTVFDGRYSRRRTS